MPPSIIWENCQVGYGAIEKKVIDFPLYHFLNPTNKNIKTGNDQHVSKNSPGCWASVLLPKRVSNIFAAVMDVEQIEDRTHRLDQGIQVVVVHPIQKNDHQLKIFTCK